MKIFITGVALFCAVFCLLTNLSSYAGQRDNKIAFGPVVSGLEGTGISTAKFVKTRTLGTGRIETLHFRIDTGKVSLHSMGGYDYVRIEGLKPYGKPGEPHLPAKLMVASLPLNTEVIGVEVKNVQYVPILTKLKIAPMPQPVPWFKKDRKFGRFIPDKKIYTMKSFFPGKLLTYKITEHKENKHVGIIFHPLQYIPKKGESILIT